MFGVKNEQIFRKKLKMLDLYYNQDEYLKEVLLKIKQRAIIEHLNLFVKQQDEPYNVESIDNLEQFSHCDINELVQGTRYRFFKGIRKKQLNSKLKQIIEETEFEILLKCKLDSINEISFIIIKCKANNNIEVINYTLHEEFLAMIKEILIKNNEYDITDFANLYVELLSKQDENILKIVSKVLKGVNQFLKKTLQEYISLEGLKIYACFQIKEKPNNALMDKLKNLKNENYLSYFKYEKSWGILLALFLYRLFDRIAKQITNDSMSTNYMLIFVIILFPVIIVTMFIVSNFNTFTYKLRVFVKNLMINIILYLVLYIILYSLFKKLYYETISTFLGCFMIFYLISLGSGYYLFRTSEIKMSEKFKFKKYHLFLRNYHYISILIINIIFILILISDQMSVIIINILLLVYFLCAVFIGLSYFKKNDDISIEFLNLDNDDIIQSKIYFSNLFFNFYDSRIFKINMENFFPENATDCEVFVLNQFYTVLSTNIDRKKKYFYFSLQKHFTNIKNNLIENHKIKVLVSYKVNEKVYRKKAIIYIDVNKKYDEIFISKYSVEQCYRVCSLFPIKELRKNVKVNNIFSLLGNSYLYNLKDIDISAELNSQIKLESKWLYHDGEYGNGKTTYDRILCMNHNYVPVRISPWEANYDEDFLYLMYMKVLQHSNIKSYMNLKSANIIVFIVLGAISSVLINYIDYLGSTLYVVFRYLNIGFEIDKSIFDTIIMNIFELANDYSIDVLTILEVFLFTIIIWIFVCKYLYQIIINQKDSSKFHQDYYIYHLLKMVRKNQLMLVIEDIDRMSSDAYQNVLRVCSCVNSNYRFTRPLGIISLSSEEIIKKENLEGRDGNQIYNDLKNKIFINEIADKFNEKQSIVLFLQSICFATYKLLLLSDKDDEYRLRLLKEIITYYFPNNFKANFRDTKYFLQQVLNIENIMKKEEYENLKVKLKELFMEDVRF